jgi:hypothetical protein
MTRTQAETDIRKIDRRCRGKQVIPSPDREELRARWDDILSRKNWRDAVLFKMALEEVINRSAGPVVQNDWEGMFRAIASLLYSFRDDCGYDVNNLIVASFPFDGRDCEAPCPKCGEIATFSTLYEVADEA